jgi:hypothetical protein
MRYRGHAYGRDPVSLDEKVESAGTRFGSSMLAIPVAGNETVA